MVAFGNIVSYINFNISIVKPISSIINSFKLKNFSLINSMNIVVNVEIILKISTNVLTVPFIIVNITLKNNDNIPINNFDFPRILVKDRKINGLFFHL